MKIWRKISIIISINKSEMAAENGVSNNEMTSMIMAYSSMSVIYG